MNNIENYRNINSPISAFAPNDDGAVEIPEVKIDAEELAIAEKEAEDSADTFTYKFKKPLMYNGGVIEEITFDWDSLTGGDSLAIEDELQKVGKMAIVPEFSGEYLIRMAARASSPRVGADFFENMPMGAYNKIRSAARSFLLNAGRE